MLQGLFQSCHLRSDITSGGIDDGQFAADLRTLLAPEHGAAPYADAKTYFSLTYPTTGLKKLLAIAAERLQRGNSNGLVVLSTSLGGGKTHSVMALYHLAKGFRPADMYDFVDPSLWPSEKIPVAAVIGDMVDVLDGATINGHKVHTLWGSMAAQLGNDAWRRLELHDATRTAPSTSALLEVFAELPAIVILDEMAAYLRAAEKSGDPQTMKLAESTPNFLKSLSEIATTQGQKVLVALTEATGDLFVDATESIRRIYSEMTSAVNRISSAQGTINPATGGEIAEILKRRLFSEVDPNAAKTIADRYEHYYTQLVKSHPLIGGSKEASEYAREICDSYPFHPALIRALDAGLSSSSRFQRTRGALKVLGDTLASLASNESDLDILNTGDLHFSDDDGTLEHLTSQLDRKEFVAIAKADFVGPDSHAARIDQQRSTTLATRFATAAFIFSLPIHDLGRSFEDLALNVLHEGEQPAQLSQVVDDGLMRSCWYLQSQDGRYVFRTEPTVNRVIDGALQAIKSYQVQQAETEYIEQVFANRSTGALKVVLGGRDPAEVADTKETTLIVFRPDVVTLDSGEDEVRKRITDFRDSAGAKTRIFKNTLSYFVAGKNEGQEKFRDLLKRSIALAGLTSSPPAGFPEATVERLRNQAAETQFALAMAFLRWFNVLYFFSVGPGDLIARTISLGEEELVGKTRQKSEKYLMGSADESLVSTRLFEAIRRELVNSKWRDAISVQDLNNLNLLGPGKKPTPHSLYEHYLMDFHSSLPNSPQAMLVGVRGLVSQGSYVAYDKREQRFLAASESTRVTITSDFELWDKSDLPEPELPKRPSTGVKPLVSPGVGNNPPGHGKPKYEFSQSAITPSNAASQILAGLEASGADGIHVHLSRSTDDDLPVFAAWTTLIAQTPKAFVGATIQNLQRVANRGEFRLNWTITNGDELKRVGSVIGDVSKLAGTRDGSQTILNMRFEVDSSVATGFVESIKLLAEMGISDFDLAINEREPRNETEG